MSMQERETALREELSQFQDDFDKLSYLIGLSAKLAAPSQDLLQDKNLVEGCQSKVWIQLRVEHNLVYLSAYSDTLILRGILALLIEIVSGEPREAVGNLNETMFADFGFYSFLSQERRSGIRAIVKRIKEVS